MTSACFTAAALALTGIPPFCGFISKWNLLSAGAETGTPVGYIGAGMIILSALLTAVYMFTTVRRMYFPGPKTDMTELQKVHEASAWMWVPMILLAASLLMTGLLAGRILDVIQHITADLIPWM